MAGFMLFAAGCGSDDEKAETTAPSPPAETQEEQTATQTEPAETDEPAPEPEPEPESESEAAPSPSPEDEPGGAGDEEPARSLALFTGRNGRVTPRVVRVPSFISIRVELRSADGAQYAVTFGGETIRVSGGLGSVSTTFDGLRPNESVTGTLEGAPGRVRIEATAEPGP